jgi:hypothetical protein
MIIDRLKEEQKEILKVSLRLNRDEIEKVQKICKKLSIKPSKITEEALKEFLPKIEKEMRSLKGKKEEVKEVENV